MSDGERLLAYCNVYPDDDLAHRAYADWLEEQGDDARAEFVRLQLDRARLWDGHPDDEDLWDRDRALVAEHGATWRAELPVAVRDSASFSRGLLTQFDLTGSELLAIDPSRRSFTILGLRLQASKVEMAAIAAGGFLRGVRSLSLLGELSTANAVALVSGDDLAGLRRLTLQGNVSPETIAILLQASTLRGLESLQLASSCDRLANLLARPDTTFHLRRLVVSNYGVPVGLHALATAESCADLEELCLTSLSVRGRSRKRQTFPSFPALRFLDFSRSRLRFEPLLRCLAVLGRCRLERLHLAYLTIQGAEIARVLECFDLERLADLTLSHNPLGEEGWAALCRTPIPSLRFLRLELTGLTPAGLAVLSYAPWLAGLRQLILGGGFGPPADAFRELLHTPAVRRLEVLSCGHMELGADIAEVIAASPHLPSLRCLALGRNKVGPAGARAIAVSPHLPSLRRLDLSWNGIGPEGGEALLASPLVNQLVRLDLTNNDLGHELRAHFRARAGNRPWQI